MKTFKTLSLIVFTLISSVSIMSFTSYNKEETSRDVYMIIEMHKKVGDNYYRVINRPYKQGLKRYDVTMDFIDALRESPGLPDKFTKKIQAIDVDYESFWSLDEAQEYFDTKKQKMLDHKAQNKSDYDDYMIITTSFKE